MTSGWVLPLPCCVTLASHFPSLGFSLHLCRGNPGSLTSTPPDGSLLHESILPFKAWPQLVLSPLPGMLLSNVCCQNSGFSSCSSGPRPSVIFLKMECSAPSSSFYMLSRAGTVMNNERMVGSIYGGGQSCARHGASHFVKCFNPHNKVSLFSLDR